MSILIMKLAGLFFAVTLWCSVSFGQESQPQLPCDYKDTVLKNDQGRLALLTSDEMKKRATHKVDVDSPLLKQADIKGTIVVRILVASSGNVACIRSISGHPMLRLPVERALRQWKFVPMQTAGKKVAYVGQMNFTFCNISCGDSGNSMTLLDPKQSP